MAHTQPSLSNPSYKGGEALTRSQHSLHAKRPGLRRGSARVHYCG